MFLWFCYDFPLVFPMAPTHHFFCIRDLSPSNHKLRALRTHPSRRISCHHPFVSISSFTSHHIIPHHSISYYIILYHTISYYILLYHTISYYILLYHSVSYYIILYLTTSYYIILYLTISTISYYIPIGLPFNYAILHALNLFNPSFDP